MKSVSEASQSRGMGWLAIPIVFRIAGVWEGYTPDSVEEIEHLIDQLLASGTNEA